MYSDPISDMLTRIRNAQMRNIENVEMPYSAIKKSIADVLKEAGYINDVKVFKAETGHKGLSIKLKDAKTEQAINHIERVSKASNRRYLKAKDIKLNLGIYVVSTSRGVVSSTEARKKKLGGEIICHVY